MCWLPKILLSSKLEDSIFKNGDEWSRFDEPKNLLLEKSSEQTSFFKMGSGTFYKFF
jgi:hypothetical protein